LHNVRVGWSTSLSALHWHSYKKVVVKVTLPFVSVVWHSPILKSGAGKPSASSQALSQMTFNVVTLPKYLPFS
jgi:hypothetical protein